MNSIGSDRATSNPAPGASRRQAREMAQDALLDVAESLAGVNGAASLSLKRLADEAGVSTMVIYSRFGDRFGLEEALLRRASQSLVAAIDEAPGTMTGVSWALREWARTHRSRFSLLFLTSDRLDASLKPEIDESIHGAARAIETRLGWGTPTKPLRCGLTALAGIVGFLSFELRGQIPEAGIDATFADLVDALATLDRTA